MTVEYDVRVVRKTNVVSEGKYVLGWGLVNVGVDKGVVAPSAKRRIDWTNTQI